MMSGLSASAVPHDGDATKPKLKPDCAAVDWLGVIPPAHLAMKDKPLRYSRRLVESRQRPKKPDPSLL
jgi:hypothetical protein